jgi:hypothetical protein
MPSVRRKTASAGPNGNRQIGYVYEVGEAEGWDLVRGGFADWVAPPLAPVAPIVAPVAPIERAVARVQQKRGKR